MVNLVRLRTRWKEFLEWTHAWVISLEPWGVFFTAFALVLAITQFWLESQHRVDERVVQAWQLIATTFPGNSGKREALEYLNNEDGWLCIEWLWKKCAIVHKRRTKLAGIDLSVPDKKKGVFLQGVSLPEADLFEANLSRAILSEAFLSGAILEGVTAIDADFSYAILSGANLSTSDIFDTEFVDADLVGANLSYTVFQGSNFTGANLSDADLSNASFEKVFGLEQAQLDSACADDGSPINLPGKLTWKDRPCPKLTRFYNPLYWLVLPNSMERVP